MSTRSLIARQTDRGFEAVYCHHDGAPRYHGPVLTGHYSTPEAVAALLDLGDLSVLGPQPGRAHAFATHHENPDAQDWCLAYGRDRADRNRAERCYACEAELLEDADNRWAKYVYLFREGRWFYRSGDDECWHTLATR